MLKNVPIKKIMYSSGRTDAIPINNFMSLLIC